jgi:hypothetical protein
MAAEQEHGGRWSGFGDEPLTDAEWRSHLRDATDREIADLCSCDSAKERDDAQDERARRIELGDWSRGA